MIENTLFSFPFWHKIVTSLTLLFLLVSPCAFSQTTNDYRSVASGDWDDASIWEVYDGTSLIAATNYPGETTGTNDVTIQSGYTVTLNLSEVEIDLNAYQYRVQVSNSASICSASNSSAATLTVNVDAVITNRKITYRVNKN